MNASSLSLIIAKEVREARQNRWFLLFAAVFASLALSLSLLGLSGLGAVGVAGFGRTAGSLLNLVMLVVPLMGLLMGALSVASEREQGTLLTLMTQPVVPSEVFFGKYLGLAAALSGALLLGFALTALVISWKVGSDHVGDYLTLVLYTFLLGLVYLSVGFAISVLSGKAATAVGVAIFAWLLFVFLSDLGLMGTAVVLRLSPSSLLWLSLLNPTQDFKLAVLGGSPGGLESFGPGGAYAADSFGNALRPVLTALLAVWALAPLLLSLPLFKSRVTP